ncbi:MULTISPECIES: hypothetical protein [Metabacillus]|uniref:hypothetical protein n=1 Tax=Metabacillus TaxID=2675233 RepID=UPI000492F5F8|nr:MULTISPECIES: hypothetical protein [Metabacillus]KEZ50907.1 hypothetical protein AZ46_0209780 [Metabacillus indicus LMG 22858]
MKKSAYAIIALVIFLAMMIINNLNMGNEAEKLKQEREDLTEQVAALKEDSAKKSSVLEDTLKENERLINDFTSLKNEIDELRTPVEYQDFLDAVQTVESYKVKGSFSEAKELVAATTGFSSLDRAGTCPCGFSYENGRGIDWKPNSVQDLKKLGIEGERIILTYQTGEMIKDDYQFVLKNTEGVNDKTLKWRIEEIIPTKR